MRRATAALLAVASGALGPRPAHAIPAFARRYKVDCVFCHDGFPKLNAAGQRFKQLGFRLKADEAFDPGSWIRSRPIVLRGSLNRSFVEDRKGVTTTVGKFISAGNLGTRLSYWMDDGLTISEGDTTHNKPDNAWLRFEVVRDGKLYARAGRMELDLPFTFIRTPHLFNYEIYLANTGFEADSIARFKEGFEIGGDLPSDARWSAAVVKGHKDQGTSGFDPAVFLRLSKLLGRQRLGGFAYMGRSKLSLDPAVTWDDDVLRLGADANLRIHGLNLYGVYMYGRNNNPLATVAQPTGTQEPISFNGGFVQADYHANAWLELTMRASVVRQPPGTVSGPKETFSTLYPGIQIFIVEHGKLSFEYGFPNNGRPRLGAIQAEFAF